MNILFVSMMSISFITNILFFIMINVVGETIFYRRSSLRRLSLLMGSKSDLNFLFIVILSTYIKYYHTP